MDNLAISYFDRSFLFRSLPALGILLLGIWCSSGTLAPYALTLHGAHVSEPCQYLHNIDHGNFVGTYLMIDGMPKVMWEWSVVLRRILYPLFAYPFMKTWGFENGGFIANLVLYIVTFILFVCYMRRRFGERAALVSGWILATYPGISYWAGLPYSYVAIVPLSLLAAACIIELERTDSWRQILLLSLLLGISFTGYDLLPFFAPPAVLVLLLQKKWKVLPFSICMMLLPSVLVWKWLQVSYGVTFANSNTAAYGVILAAYLSPPPFSEWWRLIAAAPFIGLHNFFFSNFVFLPLLFLCALGAKMYAWNRLPGLSRAEIAILGTAVLLFFFNNLAPPYEGWQLSGLWIARIYQPVFVVFLFYVIRLYSAASENGLGRAANIFVGLTVLLNATVVFGPITNWSIAEPVYYNFYRHSPPDQMTLNIERYGQRPLGFCRSVEAPAKKRRGKKRRKDHLA